MQKKPCSLPRKSLIATLIFATTLAMAYPANSWAMLVPAQTGDAVHEINDNRAEDIKTIQSALESKIIRQRLAEFKLSPEEIDSRLGKLSDEQVHQTAMQIRAVNPGGDPGDFVISLLVIGILVVLFVWLVRRI